ncbi:MAG: 2-dehydropantoate 2-reductase [Alphaproteobacteria bacterium]|nr:2-dehydropantoate 2-reductase [Alphaproteobacteria bacterium]
MRIAIVGAGAIGGMITALLTKAGVDPLLIARGATLAAIRQHGLTYEDAQDRFTCHPRVTDTPANQGPQDLIIIAVKAHQIEAALPMITPLMGPKTQVLTAINGLPWWFFQEIDGSESNTVVKSVDPNGTLFQQFNPSNIIGCAVYLAAEVVPPYTIKSSGGNRLVIGSITQPPSPSRSKVSSILEASGMVCPLSENIRSDVLNKLMGNLWANPLSVVTGATLDVMTNDPDVSRIGRRMMEEFTALCLALNFPPSITIDQRLKGGLRLGAFRTSMLQDFDRGRAIELDAILGAAIEVADLLKTPSETMQMVYALTRLRAETAGCYQKPI